MVNNIHSGEVDVLIDDEGDWDNTDDEGYYDDGFEIDILASEMHKIPQKEFAAFEDRYDVVYEAGSDNTAGVVYIGVGEGEDDFVEFEGLLNYLMDRGIETDSEGTDLREVLETIKETLEDSDES